MFSASESAISCMARAVAGGRPGLRRNNVPTDIESRMAVVPALRVSLIIFHSSADWSAISKLLWL